MRKEIEVMRVKRVPPMGKLVIEVGGQRLEKLHEVQSDRVKQRVLAAIGELISFAGGYRALENAGLAPPLEPPRGRQAREAEEGPLTPAQEAFLASLEGQLLGSAEGAPEQSTAQLGPELPPPIAEPAEPTEAEIATPVGETATPGPGDKAKEPAGETSDTSASVNLVAEIDEILQKYVGATPSLAGRSIHLRQVPAGELEILVDGKSHRHPKEIEEKTIRLVIKKALKEWESR